MKVSVGKSASAMTVSQPELIELGTPVTVVGAPVSVWHEFKSRHSGKWWMQWFISRWPVVRYVYTGEVIGKNGNELTVHWTSISKRGFI